MAMRLGASISQKMILTSMALMLLIVSLSGGLSAYYTRRVFDDATARLKDAHTTALQARARVQTRTMVLAAKNALAQNDLSSLRAFVPDVAHNDPDVLALYVMDVDDAHGNMVMAHSDQRYNQHPEPVGKVDPALGPRLSRISEPMAEIIGVAHERRFVFASPITITGERIGTLVVQYTLRGLDSDLARIEADRVATSRQHLIRTLALGLVFILLGTAIAIWQSVLITRPIKLLAWRADQIAHGDLATRVEVSSQDEIGLLAKNFNYMADHLQVLLQETANKATLEKDLEVARAVQETLVPSGDVIDRGMIRLAGYFQPAAQCGGDWWTLHDLPDGKILVAIGDVTGHGVASAMITAAAKAACDVVRTLDGENLTPSRLLWVMNRAIYESAQRSKFVMTCFAAILDPRTRSITFSNAGHNFPYLYRNPATLAPGERDDGVLMSRGNRLGDRADSVFTDNVQPLRAGDLLVFYTDGIIECENPQGREYGEREFRRSIRLAADLEPAPLRDSIMATAASFYGDRPRKDDITLVVARIK